jgi:carbamoyl-phosphate synthase small subunit
MTLPCPGRLCLADGATFEGTRFGATGAAVGEVVFTTGMTGYQEVLTDPSYTGQIVTMTAPEIGNTGVNEADPESRDGRPAVRGFVVRSASRIASSWRSTSSLSAHLADCGVVGLADVDTRRLTRHLRDHGSQNGAIGDLPRDELVDRARAAPSMLGLDLVSEVTPAAAYAWTEGSDRAFVSAPGSGPGGPHASARDESRPHVVCIDLGIKRNILRRLVDVGFRVTAMPARSSASEVLAASPDGIFLSNGPGDPSAVQYAVETIKGLLGQRPLFGICLGHQLLSLAIGASTYKLKFGHRGINQPVKDLGTGRIEITSQNHGFAVDVASLPPGVTSTHVHLNDGTSEGIEIPEADAFSVQYHPEAAAGPHDADHLFARFMSRVARAR